MINFNRYNHLTTNLQEASAESLVFYSLGHKKEEERIFLQRLKKSSGATVVINRNFETALGYLITLSPKHWEEEKKKALDFFYPLGKNIKQIGITGTNGKTTTAFLGMLIGEKNWKKSSLYIGTLGVYLNGEKIGKQNLTTPDIIEYRYWIHEALKISPKLSVVWVEVSSHALSQDRLKGVLFNYSGWTSFSQDHLDYHQNMKDYFEAKKKIFSITENEVLAGEKIPHLNAPFGSPTPLFLSSPFLKIQHNQKNYSLAFSLLNKVFGPSRNQEEISFHIPGRFQVISHKKRHFVIDYAHSPEAVKNILEECRKIWPNQKILTIIGCGGERDRSKREVMGKISLEKSHHVFFTEDNSRSEKTEDIIQEMTSSLPPKNWTIIPSRKDAIRKAFKLSGYKVVAILGKGEETQIIKMPHPEPHSDQDFLEGLIHDLSL